VGTFTGHAVGKDDLHGAASVSIAADEALLFQDIELVLNGCGGVEPCCLTDFTHRRGIALGFGRGPDEVEDRYLAGGQLRLRCGVLGHTQILPQVGDKFKQMFEKMLQMSVGRYMVFLSNKCSKTFPKVYVDSRRDEP
jgi:hypothetical protein